MKNEDIIINKKKEKLNLSSSNIKEKSIYDEDFIIDPNEKEIELFNENISLNSIISLEKQINNDIPKNELISIKQFRWLLGIFGVKSNSFIIERLYQILIRISFEHYEPIRSNLCKRDFVNYLTILNGPKINHEIFYLFFDISNKGYITKNDFINVMSNMCEIICEYTHKNSFTYKEYISNLYDYIIKINKEKNKQILTKTKFIKLIENNFFNFYDIINEKFEKNILMTKKQYNILKDIMNSIKSIRKKIKQKEKIESNLSIITNNYLYDIKLKKDEYKEMKIENNIKNLNKRNSCFINENNKANLFNNIIKNYSINKMENLNISSYFISNNNLSLNYSANNSNNIFDDKIDKNNESKISDLNLSKTFLTPQKEIKYNKFYSPQQRIKSNNNRNNMIELEEYSIEDISLNSSSSKSDGKEKSEENNNDNLDEENEDIVFEMDDNKNILNIKNLNKNIITQKSRLIKNKEKKFFFLRPFQIKNHKELEKDLKKHNININNTLLLLKKDNFLSYLETLENCFSNELNDINISNNLQPNLKNGKLLKILNMPLKQKEYFGKEKSYEITLNNTNMEIMYAIILGIQKCISALGDFCLHDKKIISSLLSLDNSFKILGKRKNTVPKSHTEKFDKTNSELYEIISNYPFKKHKHIFEEINNFHYFSYFKNKKHENKMDLNKIEIIEYAPQIFSNIRYSLGEISNKEFIKSFNIESLISDIFLGNINNLNQLLTINKDNFPEFIMFSSDNKYIVKCITQNEFDILIKMIPSYYIHLMKNASKNIHKINEINGISYKLNNTNFSKFTFLDIIFGLFSITLLNKKLFFIIKKNIFYSYSNLYIYVKYDLKGSSIDRKAKPNLLDIYKDLDYLKSQDKIKLGNIISKNIIETIEKDTLFLSQKNIINYSFLVGIAKIPESFTQNEKEDGFLSSDKKYMYYFGITDILTSYGKGKKMEYIYKKFIKGNGISVVPPNEYKNRFDNFIKSCLK